MLVQIDNATFYYNEKLVFENVNLKINEGDRIGFVGRNGEGKSTLLNSITGELPLREGEIFKKGSLRIGYLKQNSGLDSDKIVYDEMKSVFADVIDCEKSLREIEKQMSVLDHDTPEFREKVRQYNAKNAFFEANDGYNVNVKISTVLNGMGFAGKYDQTVSTMSGGEKTRLALTKLLLIAPELLILDEPTNHLDLTTLSWLENFLSTYKGSLLLVSHDRYFLDKLVNKIWDIENFGITSYNGNYSKYKISKDESLLSQQREYDKQQKQIASMEDYVRRNIVRATTSKSAKSRVKQLENMDVVDKPFVDNRKPSFRFVFDEEPLKSVICAKNLNLSAGNTLLLNNVGFEIMRGEKVALIGPNGTGKSTLIKAVVNGSNDDWSKIRLGKGVKLAYYDQENLNLNANDTVLEAIWATHHLLSQTEVRKVLAQAMLSQEDIDKRVSQLSGGERAKLGLAMTVIERANTLILDEPTNHLDLISREALEEGLNKFAGTVFFVSHDRYFINQIADRVIEIDNRQLNFFNGNYDDYITAKQQSASVAQQNKDTSVSSKPKSNGANVYLNAKERKALANAKLQIKTIESEIAEKEDLVKSLYEQIALPEVANDYKLLQEKCAQLEELKQQIDTLTDEWAQLCEQTE